MPNYGYESYVAIIKETTWGSFETPTLFVPLKKETLKGDVEWLERGSELRTSRFPATPLAGRKSAVGGLTFSAYPHIMGDILATFFGTAEAVTNPVAGVYQHSFIIDTAVARQLSVQIRKGAALPRNISGYKINELNLSQDNEKELDVDVNGFGKTEVVGVSQTATYTDTTPFLFYHAAISVASSSYYCDSFNMKFSQNYKNDNWKVGGGQYILDPPFKDRPILGGDFTINFEDWTQYDAFMAFTDIAIIATWTSTQLIQPGHYYTMTIKMPKVRYKNPMPMVSSSGLIVCKCEFDGFADTVDTYTTPLEIILKDGTATH